MQCSKIDMGMDVYQCIYDMPVTINQSSIGNLFDSMKREIVYCDLTGKRVQFLLIVKETKRISTKECIRRLRRFIKDETERMKRCVTICCIISDSRLVKNIARVVLRVVKTPVKTLVTSNIEKANQECYDSISRGD